jgi:hypothetical protein
VGQNPKKLENLPSVEDFSEEDRKFYSEIGRAILINELDSLIGAKKLSIGVIMAASMLEFAGKIRLLWKFKNLLPMIKSIILTLP